VANHQGNRSIDLWNAQLSANDAYFPLPEEPSWGNAMLDSIRLGV
jgi:hypothetical protein